MPFLYILEMIKLRFYSLSFVLIDSTTIKLKFYTCRGTAIKHEILRNKQKLPLLFSLAQNRN